MSTLHLLSLIHVIFPALQSHPSQLLSAAIQISSLKTPLTSVLYKNTPK